MYRRIHVYPLGMLLLALSWLVLSGDSLFAQQLPVQIGAPKGQAQKKIAFEMRNATWNKVLEWVSEQTGKPYVGGIIPNGTFTFIPAKTGMISKKYAMPEIIDILNESLQEQKLVLVQQRTSYTIWPADTKIDISLVPQVPIEDLRTKRGKTEIVSVILPLKTLNPLDISPEIKKIMGPFGEMVPLESSNQILLVDKVGILLRVLDLVSRIERNAGNSAQKFEYQCEYIRANDAVAKLTQYLGEPEEVKVVSSSGSNTVVRKYQVVAEPNTNKIFMTGPADKIALAKTFLTSIDKGTQKIILGPPSFQTLELPTGNAETVATNLQAIYAEIPSVKISALGQNKILIRATPDYQREIAKLLEPPAVPANKANIETVNLNILDATKAAEMLVSMFGDQTKGGPYIGVDATRNSLIIKGSDQQVLDVKSAIGAMGEVVGQGGGNMRVITLNTGSAATLAEALKELMPSLRQNPVRVILPGQEMIQPKNPQPKQPKIPTQKGAKWQLKKGFYDANMRMVSYGMPQVVQVQPKLPPKMLQGNKDQPLTITAFGNKLILTCQDPKTLATAQELIRLITQTEAGEGDFEVIPLKYADATTAAEVLDEAFNGKAKQGSGSSKGGSSRGGGGGFNPLQFFAQFAAPGASGPTGAPSAERIRVVADPGTNSLIVKAKPLDMLTIRKLLHKAIDSGETDSDAIQRTWTIGPLQYADANEIADLLETVYQQSTNKQVQSRGSSNDPRAIFLSRALGNRGSSGSNNKFKVSLQVGVHERTNTLVVTCNKLMYDDIKTMAEKLDLASKDATEIVKVVPIVNADPALVKQAIDLLGTNTGTGRTNRTNGTSTRPSSPFSRPGSGGSGFSGFRGFGGGPSSGGRGFGSSRSRKDRGRDFFGSAVKDDHSTPFYDPQSADVSDWQPVQFTDPQLAQMGQQPPPQLGQILPQGSPEIIRGPRTNVETQALTELGLLIIKTGSKADMDAILQIIDYIQIEGQNAELDVRLVRLQHGDPSRITNQLNLMFKQVKIGPNATTIVPSQQQTTTNQEDVRVLKSEGAPILQHIPWLNAILVAAPKGNMPFILKQIAQLDVANDPRAGVVPFVLKRASAQIVATQLTNFFAQRYPDDGTGVNQVRFTVDTANNTVFAQASPSDMNEIRELIRRFDSTEIGPESELRVVRLNAAVAIELADLITRAISEGVAFPSTGGNVFPNLTGPQQQQGPQQGPGQFNQQQQLGTNGPVSKSSALKFFTTDPLGRQETFKSAILEDVRIYPDIRTNSLVIAAPSKTMLLILALIRDLDRPPTAQSEVNIFTLKKSDAATVATQLQQLFLGVGNQQQQQQPGLQGQQGFQQQPGTTQGQLRPLQPAVSGDLQPGAPLIDVRITVDDRTNSIIVAGSPYDLALVEAIITRLDDSQVAQRISEVYCLRNAIAADVALSINDFYAQTFAINTAAPQFNAFLQFQSQVIIVPEPITNKLLISASPKYYAEVVRFIKQLDMLPPQVVIQALVAEVKFEDVNEFGVELGLQSPILFQRSVLPGGTLVNNAAAVPGFNFNTTAPLGQSTLASPSTIGVQGLGNFGTGRISPNAGVGGFVFSAASDSVNILVRALRTQGRLDLLSRPQVTTADNQAARILVGQSFPYIANSIVTTGVTGVPTVTNSISYRDIGIQLQVTPKINPDGSIIMRVVPEISNVEETNIPITEGVFAVAFNVETVETTVIAQDGETVIIGGLIARRNLKEENKIPWFGDLPGVGALFRYRQQLKEKTELVVLLTPHVIRNRMDADRILAEESRRMDWVLGDVLKAHGPRGMAPVMPDYKLPPHSGHPMVGSPYDLPGGPLMPGQQQFPGVSGQRLMPNQGPEGLPQPQPLPPKEKLPNPAPQGNHSSQYQPPPQPILMRPQPNPNPNYPIQVPNQPNYQNRISVQPNQQSYQNRVPNQPSYRNQVPNQPSYSNQVPNQPSYRNQVPNQLNPSIQVPQPQRNPYQVQAGTNQPQFRPVANNTYPQQSQLLTRQPPPFLPAQQPSVNGTPVGQYRQPQNNREIPMVERQGMAALPNSQGRGVSAWLHQSKRP